MSEILSKEHLELAKYDEEIRDQVNTECIIETALYWLDEAEGQKVENEQLITMLKRLEWSAEYQGMCDLCPICNYHKNSGEHKPDCELNALLQESANETK